ncbi:MAG: hypothetical protein P4M09_08685 [Devosia sp.]|nr:hypothetical protein [Devosia sp.]
MKIKSLLLGSIAAAGLATGAHAADLQKGVMTSLDVCDALGLSGLTISSDTDCLQLTGSVSYMFAWGDYKTGIGSAASGQTIVVTPDDTTSIPVPGDSTGTSNHATDWDTQMIAWLQAVGSSDTDFGVAKAVIKIRSEQYRHTYNGYGYFDGDDTGGSTTNTGTEASTTDGNSATLSNSASGTLLFDKAYVSVGDSTVLTAGKTGTIINTGDDTPLNWLGLFNAENTSSGGVLWSVSHSAGGTAYAVGPDGRGDTSGADIQTGGHSIQLTSSLGNGVTIGGALEDLQDTHASRAGTAVGVISYAGDNLTAHLSLIEAGILDGHPDVGAYHAGFTGTFDKFKLVAAVAGDSTGYWDGLASAQLTLDMFKLAGSVEGTHDYNGVQGLGAGASASLTVSDGVTLNIGGRYFDSDTASVNTEGYQGAIALVAAVTETLTLEGDIGVYGTDSGGSTDTGNVGTAGTWLNTYYGAASVTWAPGTGFTSSLKGEVYSNGAYKATFNASKSFQ